MDESGKPHGLFFSSQLLSPLFHLPAGTENENEIDVWLAIKKEEFKQVLINISSPSIRSDGHWG